MATHVRVLGVLYIALSAIGVVGALFLMLALGTATSIVGLNAEASDAAVALPIIGIAGTALVTFLLAVSVPGLVVGIGLINLKPWARIGAMVLAVIHLINIPIGTALGIYALWVLFNKDTERLFTPEALPVA
ncbi:MAG: hypothetical protein ABIQ52_18495 [Vicinamibacterales bacterium]